MRPARSSRRPPQAFAAATSSTGHWLHRGAARRAVGRLPGVAGSDGTRRHAARLSDAASFDRAKTVGAIVTVLDWPKVIEMLHGGQGAPRGPERARLLAADGRERRDPRRSGVHVRSAARAEHAGLAGPRRDRATATCRVGQRDDRDPRSAISGRLCDDAGAALFAQRLAHGAAHAKRRGVRAPEPAAVDDRPAVGVLAVAFGALLGLLGPAVLQTDFVSRPVPARRRRRRSVAAVLDRTRRRARHARRRRQRDGAAAPQPDSGSAERRAAHHRRRQTRC